MEFDATEAPVRREPYEAPVQGYESWYDSELSECATRCIAELERRGVMQRTKVPFLKRLSILFKG